jgi:hypothetical protein
MYKTKLVKILKSFSKSEIKAFGIFVRSIYGNSDSKILLLLNEIINNFFEFNNKDFTKKHLYKKIYPNSRYNDARLRKLISYLNNLAEEFLTHQGLKKDDFARKLYLLRELSLRNSDTVFEQEAALIEKKMKKYPRNTTFYHNRFRFLNIINSHHALRKRSIAVDNYQKEADSFFHYFFIEALNVYIYLINEKKISNREFELTLFNEVIGHLGTKPYSEILSIQVYYNCLMIILAEEEKYFHILREIQKKLEYKIHGDELRITYIVLQNFCVSQVKKGIIKFKREAFELQRESVLKRLHLTGERIHIFTFLNIVSEAVSVGELVWAENFIKENRSLLEPEHEFDIVNLSYAKCEFSRKEYEMALTRLGKINMEYSQFKLSVKTLMLMIYYELTLYDSAISLLDSYKHFITRDKLLPEIDRQNHINFIKYFSEVLSLKMSSEGIPDIIRKNILSSGGLIEKEWLLEKIDELK